MTARITLARASLLSVGLVLFVGTLALSTHRSGMPTVLGRYSAGFFALLLLLLVVSIGLALFAVIAPFRFVARFLLASFTVWMMLMLIDLSAYILAPVLPYQTWLQLPYQVKKRTYLSRPETMRVQQTTVIEQDYWAFEPYGCKQWPLMFGPDPIAESQLPTVEVCHDEIGFRNPLGLYTDSARVDVVTLGDSFTYGFGSRQGWPDILRDLTGVTVLNLAQVGGTVPEWIGAFEQYGMSKTPSLVIAATWDGNDFIGLEKLEAIGPASPGQSELEHMMGVIPTSGTNPLYRLADYSTTLTLLSKAALQQTGEAANHTMILNLDSGRTEMPLWTNRRPDFADDERLWALYEKGLGELKALTDQSESKLVLVYFTTASVVYAPYESVPSASVVADVDNNHRISSRLASIASAHGFWFLDTTSLLQERAAHTPLLYAWDGHLTQEGYQAVAEIVFNYLVDQNLPR